MMMANLADDAARVGPAIDYPSGARSLLHRGDHTERQQLQVAGP